VTPSRAAENSSIPLFLHRYTLQVLHRADVVANPVKIGLAPQFLKSDHVVAALTKSEQYLEVVSELVGPCIEALRTRSAHWNGHNWRGE